jgi:hypothetical protein
LKAPKIFSNSVKDFKKENKYQLFPERDLKSLRDWGLSSCPNPALGKVKCNSGDIFHSKLHE